MSYDFCGWATRNDIRCSDGRVIKTNAFVGNDGTTVPLVWNHQHNDSQNILGHALLENRKEGVYAYCSFNDTAQGRNAKLMVEHGDISALSIYANKLKQKGSDVIHGAIREVSLVLAGANPGAYIESIIRHGEESDDEAIIYSGDKELLLYHGEEEPEEKKEEAMEKTVEQIYNELTDEQKKLVHFLVGQAVEDAEGEMEGDEGVKHNVFDTDEEYEGNVLTHSEMTEIISDAKRYGSLKDSVLAHGIEHIDYLFPEAKTLTNQPQLISRNMEWVKTVMNGVHRTPFSRIKSVLANITADEARAKGYIKGNQKKDEVFTLLKRTTSPTTIYKKQKLDRDDVVDITDLDVIAFIKAEMRTMLDEEIARAILVGDGRMSSSDEKIKEDAIRPIWKDDDLYTVKAKVEAEDDATAAEKAKAFIVTAIKSRKEYKGSGEPTLFTTEDVLTDCLLLEDKNGRIIYDSVDKLATALRVSKIVAVPVMENQKRTDSSTSDKLELMGIMVNLRDYNVGADKGGAVNMFDDFDIDYNAMKYLIETRCSGALTMPYSAVALERKTDA